jgi:hypothetical protein
MSNVHWFCNIQPRQTVSAVHRTKTPLVWVLTRANAAIRRHGHAATPRTSVSYAYGKDGLTINSEDCAPGTWFEGACAMEPSGLSLDGTCGPNAGNTRCAGKWGSCCSYNGVCGSGDDFCSKDNCYSGACVQPDMPESTGPVFGTSPDGSCGGTDEYTCGVIVGSCCNKDNKCGSYPTDCGTGWYVCKYTGPHGFC